MRGTEGATWVHLYQEKLANKEKEAVELNEKVGKMGEEAMEVRPNQMQKPRVPCLLYQKGCSFRGTRKCV